MKNSRIGILLTLICLMVLSFLFRPIHADTTEKRYWIMFEDKENDLPRHGSLVELGQTIGLSERSLIRRSKVRDRTALVDETDLPVSFRYIETIRELGINIHVVSRWLNAVSAPIPENLLNEIKDLPFVKSIKPVAKCPVPKLPYAYPHLLKPHIQEVQELNYGYSYTQNALIHIPEVHQLGITGKDVLIGVIDTGFDYQGRSVFSHLDVVAEYDFHWDDEITANQEGDVPNQHDHGTQVLSVVGGYQEGYLIGPAFNASYALAKTEWLPVTDDTLEEDHWVEGIEWLDSLGADVVNSSLSYYYFVNGPSYTYEDLDGNTCEVTVAADIAASKGMVVVSSAGNEGSKKWHYITPPSDGDSVVAVGAVTMNENLWSSSSVGPTFDGRTKPDVVAMGVGVYTVNPDRYSAAKIVSTTGTSVSSPQVAGICAMVLEAHPELGPMDVINAIRETADRADSSNNEYGWGLVNAYKAIFYHGTIFTDFIYIENPLDNTHGIELKIISQIGIQSDSVYMFCRAPNSVVFEKYKLSLLGGEGSSRYRAVFPSEFPLDSCQFYISVVDSQDAVHLGPIGAPDILYTFSGQESSLVVLDNTTPSNFRLYQNYPNPFNNATTIAFDVIKTGRVTLNLYNVRGQRVCTLIDGILDSGRKEIVWNGSNEQGFQAASGIYLIEICGNDRHQVRKMILVR